MLSLVVIKGMEESSLVDNHFAKGLGQGVLGDGGVCTLSATTGEAIVDEKRPGGVVGLEDLPCRFTDSFARAMLLYWSFFSACS